MRSITREASAGTPSPVAERLTAAKHLFERVRIPLAKFEASRRNPNDGSIAYPAISPLHGVAWLIADKTFVSRRQLSDAFLALLSDLQTERECERSGR
jgi:hypothetical protein